MKASIPSTDPRWKHVRRHLKKANGDELRIGILDQSTGTATISWDEKKENLNVFDFKLRPLPALPRVELILCMMQPNSLKRLWPVLSSLGVSRITISGSDLCDSDYCNSSSITESVYGPLILQGLSQSGVPRMPRVDCHAKNTLEWVLDHYDDVQKKNGGSKEEEGRPVVRIGLDNGSNPSIRTIIFNAAAKARSNKNRHFLSPRVVLVVGPERGLSEQEAKLLEQKGFCLASMGPWIQRTDVACITSIALATDALREVETSDMSCNQPDKKRHKKGDDLPSSK